MKLSFIILIILLSCNTQDNKSVSQDDNTIEQEIETKSLNKDFQNGDLIFQTSLSNQSLAIQIATKSKYSHMGIIYQEGEQFFVYEAVQPVKTTPINDWIKRGKNGHYVVKRVVNSNTILTNEGISKMKKIGRKYLNKDYDLKFLWSDDKIYCSELVWKIYKETFNIEIGQPQKIMDFDLSDEIVKAKMHERYGNDIPMDELIITPDRMFKSELLETIIEK